MAEGFIPQQGVLQIFTDGSCIQKTGAGGWGVRLMWNGGHKDVWGGASGQTNNTMELTAILQALKARKRDVPTIIYSDSQYCINCVTVWWPKWKRNGWLTQGGTPVQNRELIEEIVELITEHVRFRWVRGHAGQEHNEAVDELALKGRLAFGGTVEGGRAEQVFSVEQGASAGDTNDPAKADPGQGRVPASVPTHRRRNRDLSRSTSSS